MKVLINNKKYEVIKNVGDAINTKELSIALTDYFESFDFILGDYAYGKLRLKGFNNKENKNFKPINDIDSLEEYLKNHCAFGCRYFVISNLK